MKPQVCFFYRITVMLFCVLAGFSACRTTGLAFKTPGEINELRATVYLQNEEDPVTGYLSLNTAVSNHAYLRLPHNRETKVMPLNEIKGYELEDVFYARKYLQPDKRPFVWMRTAGGKYAFVKQLTPGHYSINLYQYDELVQEAKSPLTRTVQHYYVSLPGDNHVVWPLQSQTVKDYWKELHTKMSTVSGADPDVEEAFAKLGKRATHTAAILKVASLYEVYKLHEN